MVTVGNDRPHSFLVKVNARKSGLYGLEIEVLLSHGAELQRIEIKSFMRVAFLDKRTAGAENR
jgi:hypothetical protein